MRNVETFDEANFMGGEKDLSMRGVRTHGVANFGGLMNLGTTMRNVETYDEANFMGGDKDLAMRGVRTHGVANFGGLILL